MRHSTHAQSLTSNTHGMELVIDIYNSEPSQLHADEAILRHSGSPPALKRRHTAPGRISGDHRAHATASPQSPPGTHSRLRHLRASCAERSDAPQKDHPNTVRLRHTFFRGLKLPSIKGGWKVDCGIARTSTER